MGFCSLCKDGAIKQLGERYNGIVGSVVRSRLAPPFFLLKLAEADGSLHQDVLKSALSFVSCLKLPRRLDFKLSPRFFGSLIERY